MMLVREVAQELLSRTPQTLEQPTITFVGIGGAGIRVLKHLEIAEANKLVIDNDPYSLAFSECERQIDLSEPAAIPPGTRREVSLYASALLRWDEIRDALEGDIVVLISGLGGGTGTGVGPAVASIARQKGLAVLAFLIWPFKEEGLGTTAETGLEALRNHCSATLVLDNDAAMGIEGVRGQSEAMEVVNAMVARMVEDLVEQVSETFPFSIHEEIREFLKAAPAVNEPTTAMAPTLQLDPDVVAPVAMSPEGIIRIRGASNPNMATPRSSSDDELQRVRSARDEG